MSTLSNRYEIIEQLGTGATSRVDKARDTVIGRTVAVKTFLSGFDSRQLQEQFLREAQIVGQLAHPFIVSLYDVGTDANGYPYFIMEYVEGESLEKALEAAPFPMEKSAAWGGDLATALAQAHQARILHGDVKPANILVTSDGRLKLGDFGIARCGTQVTSSGNIKGTPAYLAPEQIVEQKQDERSDLFSLGIILYRMASGVHPFDGSSIGAVCAQIISASPPPPSRYNPALSPEFDQVVMRCLAKNPAERFATANELAASLYPLARTKSASAVPTREMMPADSFATRSRVLFRTVVQSALRSFPSRPRQVSRNSKASWWNRPLPRTDMWYVGGALAVFLISLVPVVGALRSHHPSNPVEILSPEFTSSNAPAPSAEVTFSASSESTIPDTPIAEHSGDSTHDASKPAPAIPDPAAIVPLTTAKPSHPHIANHDPSQSNALRAAAKSSGQKKSSEHEVAASRSVATEPNAAAKPIPNATPQQTSLHIDVVSEVSDNTLAIYSDDSLLLKTPLEPAHRGDTLRFSCPITSGEHNLRVMVFHSDKELVAQKENSSELHADGGNVMEVHINRHSKMLVKHQTALEIVWPSRTLAAAQGVAQSTLAQSAR